MVRKGQPDPGELETEPEIPAARKRTEPSKPVVQGGAYREGDAEPIEKLDEAGGAEKEQARIAKRIRGEE